ncbi:hypothetical protein HYE60_05985 [Aggregatibacter actinomycetemcomitans]|uniref:hypothetical protein n=1 Tax=Aggregatibacter actinomycetemcomitans TaxID=714 RepID=UPI00197B5901|nr:hypothetical protein [Aggregatibacter actinomycetemcomitans]MBN6074797.1 hypothetical protein [Aggregatibacter actinomycetemcomitans]
MSTKNLYKEYLAKHYPYLEQLDILDEDNKVYRHLIESSWSLGGAVYTFPFSMTGVIDVELYDVEKIKARNFLKAKILEMKSDFGYIGLYINEKYILVYVSINNLKAHIKEFLDDYLSDDFKIFNDKERVMIQKGEYEWEVVVL